MSSTRKQQIRPRFVDLAEFDDDQYAHPAHHQRNPDGPRAFDWPAAATVVRKPPPTIGAASASKADTTAAAASSPAPPQPSQQPHPPPPSKTKVVRIAPDSSNQVQHIEPRQSQTTSSSSSSGFSFGPSSQPSRRPSPYQPTASHHDDHQMPNRFSLDFGDDQGAQGEPEGSGWGSSGPVEAGAPLIGTVSERRPARAASTSRTTAQGDGTSASRPKKSSGSRFMASRQMDADVRRSASESRAAALARAKPLEEQEPGTGFPRVPRRDVIDPILPRVGARSSGPELSEDVTSAPAPGEDRGAQAVAAAGVDQDEEWLDENGRPMSAFRKSRLLKQGLRPPATRKTRQEPSKAVEDDDDDAAGYVRDPTRDPGGGADPESITAMLASVASENADKVKTMRPAEVEEELRSLEALFGKNVLDALRARKPAARTGESRTDPAAAESERVTERETTPDARPHEATTAPADPEAPESIRKRYFPTEPAGRNASLEWMMPQGNQEATDGQAKGDDGQRQPSHRFDFEGCLVDSRADADSTYVAGLHHHGDDQEAPGYTTDELLHLARSSVAAQRQLALNVLGRVCSTYPALHPNAGEGDAAGRLPDSERATIQARTIAAARWLLQDRNFSVRSAALRCLAAAIRSGPAGERPTQGSALRVDWKELGLASRPAKQVKDKDDMAFEDIVKADWVDFLIGSGFLDLPLERIDALVASSWDVEMLLEILWRMASCSADRARRIFGADEKWMKSLIIDLGLKASWPPVQGSRSMDWPSLSALRLLHLGVMADRETAKAMVLDGTIDHLLRFVMLYPWKLEEELAPADGAAEEGRELVVRAYELMATCFEIYTSLGLYGQYASVAGRTWSVWQDVGAWACRFIKQQQQQQQQSGPISHADVSTDELQRVKALAAERFFQLLETWTVCAKDPHQLLSHHDITWTQVRDWVDVSLDALSALDGEAIGSGNVCIAGAAAGHLVAWLDCCKGKQPVLMKEKRAAIESTLRITDSIVVPAIEALRFDQDEAATVDLESLSSFCRAVSNVQRLHRALIDDAPTTEPTRRLDTALSALSSRLLAASALWQHLRNPIARARGEQRQSSAILNLVSSTRADANDLLLLPLLGGSDRALLHRIVSATTERTVGVEGLAILAPFLDEYICGGHAEARRTRVLASSCACLDVHPRSERLQHRGSLFYDDETSFDVDGSSSSASASDTAEEGADNTELDPITHTPFWRSPSSFKLPLRSDWPLLALDELLHSANSAALNRRDNLPPSFDANETAIVETSLRLAVGVFSMLLSRFDAVSASTSASASASDADDEEEREREREAIRLALPSAEAVRMGVAKVFYLEHGQIDSFIADSRGGMREAGTLTGREIFRDPPVSALLEQLLDIADELALRPCLSLSLSVGQDSADAGGKREEGREGETLDDFVTQTMGPSTSFYTLYTNLLGLYDAISFGDVVFARLLLSLSSQRTGLGVEYRRLLWNDYGEALLSMRVEVGGRWGLSPYVGVEKEEDRDMKERYRFVLGRLRERGGCEAYLPFRIAEWYLGPEA